MKILEWVKANKILVAIIVVVAIGVIAFLVTSGQVPKTEAPAEEEVAPVQELPEAPAAPETQGEEAPGAEPTEEATQ